MTIPHPRVETLLRDHGSDRAGRQAARQALIDAAVAEARASARLYGLSIRCEADTKLHRTEHRCRNDGSTCLCACHDLPWRAMKSTEQRCPFCERIAKGDDIEVEEPGTASFEPLRPVTPGHRLFVSRRHVEHASEDPRVAGMVMIAAARAAARMGGDFDLITSIGPAATQTVRHLHIHLVPRREGDGLALPWPGRRPDEEAAK